MAKSTLRTDMDFDAFYERNWKYVYRLCYTYMKSEFDSEDCTEDVFVKVLTSDITFNDEAHERKWLTLTAINLCKDRLKKHNNKNVVSIDDDTIPEIVDKEEDYSYVKEAIMSLPNKYKDVIWLYYYDGYSTAEMADMLNRSHSTIRNQLSDARKKLKKILEKEKDNG